jgi:hypothetical protein
LDACREGAEGTFETGFIADGGGESLTFDGRSDFPLGMPDALVERAWGADVDGGDCSGTIDRRYTEGRFRGAETLVLGFDDDEDPVPAAVLDGRGCRELAPEIAAVGVLVRPNCGTQRGR